MLKRIILGLVFVAVIALAYVGYTRWQQNRAMESGEVSGGPSAIDSVTSAILPKSVSQPTPARQPVQPSTYSAATSSDGRPSAASAPTTDSMPANPPNGVAYAGAGHFQVYRQGNLTYRINTDTGQSCVLYATEEEWRKPRVYQHGCGNSAAQ